MCILCADAADTTYIKDGNMVINEPDMDDILYEYADVMTDYFLLYFGKLYICIGNYLDKVVAEP